MKKFITSLIVATLLGLVAVELKSNGAEAVTSLANPFPAQPMIRKFSVDGIERTAIIVPNSAAAPKDGLPLIFIFHGHGGNARNSFNRFAVHKHWPEAVVAYMQGLPTITGRDPQDERPGWQNAPGLHGDRDLKFFDAVLDWAKKNYKIDPNRIFAGGHSNGGGMTYALWSARSNVIAAFAPSASVFGYKAVNAKPKPALLIVGKSDVVVPTENQERNLEVVLKLNQCVSAGQEIAPNIKLYKSKAGADTTVFIHNGGHQMPANTGEIMVKFFKEQRLR